MKEYIQIIDPNGTFLSIKDSECETITIIDSNNNRIVVGSIDNIHIAIKQLKTLVNCHNCVNCENCENCNFCIDCHHCFDSNYCVDSYELYHCNYCNYCSNCNYCNNCSDCYCCIHCYDSKKTEYKNQTKRSE